MAWISVITPCLGVFLRIPAAVAGGRRLVAAPSGGQLAFGSSFRFHAAAASSLHNSRFDSPQRRSFVAIRLVDALPTSFPGRVFLARDEKLTIRKCRSEWMLVQLYRGSRSSCTRTGVISSATGEFPAAEDELAD